MSSLLGWEARVPNQLNKKCDKEFQARPKAGTYAHDIWVKVR